MIAIPIDSITTDAESSKLFGNVAMFALSKPTEDSFEFVKNDGTGNGIETAKFLKNIGVTTTVYSYMGDGPFNELHKNGIDIFYLGKEPMKLANIMESIEKKSLVKVDASNATTYLDPGTATENCECGCK